MADDGEIDGRIPDRAVHKRGNLVKVEALV